MVCDQCYEVFDDSLRESECPHRAIPEPVLQWPCVSELLIEEADVLQQLLYYRLGYYGSKES